jgi:PAS domain S-box-containing protein
VAKKDKSSESLASAGPYFLSLVEAGQDCVRVLSPDGVLHHMNAHGRQLLELDDAHAHLGSYWPLLWPATFKTVVEDAVTAARDGRATHFRGFCPTAKGASRWWDTSVVPIRGAGGSIDWLLATSRDITRQIEIGSFLSTTINLLPVSLMVKSARDGRYVLINKAAEAMLGVRAEDMVGRAAADLFPPAVAAAFAAEDAEVIASGQVKTTTEEPVVMINGELRYFDTKKVATRGEDGAHHIVAVAEDVTDRFESSRALKTALAKAEEASQAKLSFLANISHELRTPLNGVVGLSDSLARAPLAPRERDLAGMVLASAKTLQRLLNDVIDVASLDTGELAIEPDVFALASCVHATASPWRRLAKAKGLRLTIQLDADVMVYADHGRVGQIISNLLSNAVKFTPSGRITIRGERHSEAFRVLVTDTGVGVPADQAERIFERFNQADAAITRRYGGAGLGLPFARDLATRMGGALGYESGDEGSVFWLELPLAQAAPPTEPSGPDPERPLRFLVADDHPTNRLVIETILEPFGDVIAVADGRQALDAFAAATFDVVLMDLQMPVMDGLTAIAEIRAFEGRSHRSRTPIVVVSASALPEHVEIARAAGADLHLAKPVQLHRLVAALDVVLAATPSAEPLQD